ncbi:MAG: excinuclease ABC subunit UvrC, partial [Gammaproteobacteria bacterium]|nr:excinuclease ABC subunit UvrC [Gammaproteobacteria bacterium]
MTKDPATEFDAKAFLASLTTRPGVYRMLDARGQVLYVGKARNLKRRVANYFQRGAHPAKTMALIAETKSVEVTVTHTETEALFLENNLIKTHKPRFNVLLRDDKSYPYIHLTQHDFPRLSFYRGARKEKGSFFGPYPNAGAVRETLNYLQKLFLLRQCEDSFFSNRSRPCLQFQIKRCSAPCVGNIDREDYAREVENAVKFLEGKNDEVVNSLVARMEAASAEQSYEKAAALRDQIARLKQAQEKQYVSGDGGDFDVLAVVYENNAACVAAMFIRNGRNLGSKTFFPRNTKEYDAATVLDAFLPQYYLGKTIPPEILINERVENTDLLEEIFTEQAGYGVSLKSNLRGDRARWSKMAAANAKQALLTRLASDAS